MIQARVERTFQLARGSTWKHLKELRRGQWLDSASSRAEQEGRLSALLRHAARHVPYYRQILTEAGVWEAPGRVVLERFEDLPVLNKATMRSRYEDLKSDDLGAREWRYYASGGSTGEPIRVILDRDIDDWKRASRFAIDDLIGRKPGEKRLIVWGSVRDLEKAQETFRVRLGQRMRNEVYLNSFHLSPELVPSYVDFMNQYRPQHIYSWVDSIVELARGVERRGLAVHSPKTITTTAERLQPDMRELIVRVFRSEVFDHYGSREVGWIGTDCHHHEGLHVPLQSLYLEVLRDDGRPASPGETGRIVGTSLINHALPLIRYEMGDLGAWAEAPCRCGRVWPLLREVKGRSTDNFVRRDGTLVAGEYFNHVFFGQQWIQRYQVVQEAVDDLRVAIVLCEGRPDLEAEKTAGLEDALQKIRLAMGESCAVSFEFVDHIEPTASGKFRFTLSKVHGESGG